MDFARASSLISRATGKEEAKNIVNRFVYEMESQGLNQDQQVRQLIKLGNRISDTSLALNDLTDPTGTFRDIRDAAIEEINLQIKKIGNPDSDNGMSPPDVYSTILDAQGIDHAHVRVKMKGTDFYWTGYATTGSGVDPEQLHEAEFHAKVVKPAQHEGDYRFKFSNVDDVQVIES